MIILNSENKKPRVLVVDDERNIRQAIFHVLKSEFDITLAENGNRAVEIIECEDEFDVVSLDLEMPGMSGIETLKMIKQMSPATEVLIITAHSDIDSAKGAIKFGAYEYLDKPFKNSELRRIIRKGVKRRLNTKDAEMAVEQLDYVKAQLIQSEKFSEIGKLIARVTHELNNPLSTILGLSDLALLDKTSREDERAYFEKINKSALLCKNIIENLLSFSRKKETVKEPININNVINATLDLKRYDLKKNNISVMHQLSENMPSVLADHNGLQQVFLNMINNAQHAMRSKEGEGTLKLKSESDDKVIRASVCDTGPGIPKENIQRIFEPLFTTKKRGEGTGFGLSICYDIIKEHEGNIFVASEENKGACFVIEIPVIAQTMGHTALKTAVNPG